MRRRLIILGLCGALALTAVPAGDGASGNDPSRRPRKPCPATMEECLTSMIERFKKMGLIGLDGKWDPEIGGYRIENFLEGSVAEAAGVQVGDILVKVNGIALKDEEAYKADAKNRQPGDDVSVTVLRDGAPLTVRVTLIPVPADVMAREIGLHMMESHSPARASRQDPDGG